MNFVYQTKTDVVNIFKNLRANGLRHSIKKFGLKFVVFAFFYYLIRDGMIYIVLPYLLYLLRA